MTGYWFGFLAAVLLVVAVFLAGYWRQRGKL